MRRDPTGLMRPCPRCSKPMMASTLGRGFCLACADPSRGIPLVPVSSSVKRFMAIQTKYERAVREYDQGLPEGSRIGLAWNQPRSRKRKRKVSTGRPRGRRPQVTLNDVRHLLKSGPMTARALSKKLDITERHARRLRAQIRREEPATQPRRRPSRRRP